MYIGTEYLLIEGVRIRYRYGVPKLTFSPTFRSPSRHCEVFFAKVGPPEIRGRYRR